MEELLKRLECIEKKVADLEKQSHMRTCYFCNDFKVKVATLAMQIVILCLLFLKWLL